MWSSSGLLLSALSIGIVTPLCFDNGDKEISGKCYKFVAQRMSFEDARNWCHFKNPVTQSYLAYVPDQTTASFLSTYARSLFNTNNGDFWIGLSRNRSANIPFHWDNGNSLIFSLLTTINEDFAAQSILNSKWNTYQDTTKLPFVCSYDPTAPPTFPTSAPSTPTMAPPNPTTTDYTTCTADTPFVILFAYSNDFNQSVVRVALDSFEANLANSDFPITYSKLANVRFDLKQPEEVQFHYDMQSLQSSVLARLPDPSLGFNDASTGSDVLDMLRKFQSPNVCGARVMLLLKRSSNEHDYSNLISQLQHHRIFIQTAASLEPSGGNNPQAVYDVSSQTNGFFIFSDDPRIPHYLSNCLSSIYSMSLIYAVNPVVIGSANGMELLPIQVPTNIQDVIPSIKINAYVLINVVDNIDKLNQFVSFNLRLVDGNGNTVSQKSVTQEILNQSSTFWSRIFELPHNAASYRVLLDYVYSSSDANKLEIRVDTYTHESFWPPYGN